jgi:hypothetical protein
MTKLKLALCSALLVTTVVAAAATPKPSAAPDKRVITMTPVRPQGYMLYNFGLTLLLRKDLTQVPPSIPLPPDFINFLSSYDVANVVLPARPSYNGSIKFDILRTNSGQGVGHYEFVQTYANNMVTLRVIDSPVPSIPFFAEMSQGLSFMSAIVDEQEGQPEAEDETTDVGDLTLSYHVDDEDYDTQDNDDVISD